MKKNCLWQLSGKTYSTTFFQFTYSANKTRKLSVISLLTFLFIAFHSAAQLPGPVMDQIGKSMPKPIPASPNVASLGRFGSYEVGHYTGLPEISIPIYEVKSGGLTVPITLSYHASGVRMMDPGSWVGYGWSLSAGGQISRDTRADPDEDNYYSSPLYEFPSLCGPTEQGNYFYINNIAKEVYDADPDIFSYSFLGKSGRFILGHRGENPYLFPFEPLKITHSGMGSSLWSIPLDQFDILNEDGVLYRFGKNSLGQTFGEVTTVDRGAFYPSTSQTAWPLAEIVAPNSDDKITFDYQSAGNAYISEPRNFMTIIDNCNTTNSVQKPCPDQGPQVMMNGTNNYGISQLGLKEILFEGGKVKFILGAPRSDNFGGNSSLQTLDSIKIYSETAGVYTLTKAIKFVYEYFGYTSNPLATVRLKLKEIQFYAADNLSKPVNRYTFAYHTDNFSWLQGNQYSKDYWGYYNGKLNGDLIPTQSIQWTPNGVNYFTQDIGSADRNTDPQYMKEGVLKRITFPTGGYTEFDYEAHRYQENGVTQYAGGLRVTSIKSYDGSGASPITKTYKYGDGETGFGVKNFFNSLLYYKTEDAVHDICCITQPNPELPMYCPGTLSYTVRNYFSNSAIEIGSQDGSPVVYPVVTEYFGDASTNIGKIIYEYDNKTYTSDSLNIIIGPQSSKNYKSDLSWRRGKLTKKTVYDNTGKPITESAFVYSILRREKRNVGTAVDEFRTYPSYSICQTDCPSFPANLDPIDHLQYFFASYYQATGALKLTSSTETFYQDGLPATSLVNSSSYKYDPNYLLLTEEANTDKDGQLQLTRIKYPGSYTFPGSETGVAKALLTLKNKNAIGVPVEQYTLRQNSDGSNSRVTSGQVTTYIENPNNANQVIANEVYLLENDVAVTSYTPTSLTSSSLSMNSLYKLRAKYRYYDGQGNIAEIQKTDDKITSYVWGYHNSLPIAEVQNTDKGEQPDTFTDQIYQYGSSFTTNFTTDVALTPSITIGHDQTATYSINIFQAGGTTPSVPSTLDVVLKKSDGTIVYDPSLYLLGTYSASLALSAGTYTFYYKGAANSNPPTNTVTVRFTITVNYQTKNTTNPKVFHTSFEETGILSSNAKTGSRVNPKGTYVVNLPSTNGKYWLTWFESTSSSGPWTYQQQLLTVPGTSTYSIGSSTLYVDEVRLYPENATMTTYTYDPVLGATSTTDANNVTTYYMYDGFSRLQAVKDDKGNIIKVNAYHYYKQ